MAWVAPSPASALEPFRPLPGYRPDFVTETDTRPVVDCLWASGAMLLDKWTNGALDLDRQRLRALSGDRRGGSSFDELKVAYGKLGINLRYSPDGGAPMTWAGLLRRLKAGAGAVIQGDDSKLPRWFGRWDYGFWKNKGVKDNHAVYVERYDPKHRRVWIMDPLGHGDWKGEWIGVAALHRFAWFSGSKVYAAVSPVAEPGPFAGVELDGPEVTVSDAMIDASWDVLEAPAKWRLPGVDAKVTFTAAKDPLLAAAQMPDLGVLPPSAEPPEAPTIVQVGASLQLTAPLPEVPGAYTAAVAFHELRLGREVGSAEDVPVFVPGPRRASVRLDAPDRAVAAGGSVKVSLVVANTGEVTWDEEVQNGGAQAEGPIRATRVIAYWIPLEMAPADDGTMPEPVAMEPLVLRRVPFAPRHLLRTQVELAAPAQPGSWVLVVDVVDDVDGSFAAHGSRPATLQLDVVEVRRVVPV